MYKLFFINDSIQLLMGTLPVDIQKQLTEVTNIASYVLLTIQKRGSKKGPTKAKKVLQPIPQFTNPNCTR